MIDPGIVKDSVRIEVVSVADGSQAVAIIPANGSAMYLTTEAAIALGIQPPLERRS